MKWQQNILLKPTGKATSWTYIMLKLKGLSGTPASESEPTMDSPSSLLSGAGRQWTLEIWDEEGSSSPLPPPPLTMLLLSLQTQESDSPLRLTFGQLLKGLPGGGQSWPLPVQTSLGMILQEGQGPVLMAPFTQDHRAFSPSFLMFASKGYLLGLHEVTSHAPPWATIDFSWHSSLGSAAAGASASFRNFLEDSPSETARSLSAGLSWPALLLLAANIFVQIWKRYSNK